MEDTKKFLLCSCSDEALLLSVDDKYKEISFALYKSGQFNTKPSLWQRVKYCWYHLRTGKKYEDQVSISFDKAKDMVTWVSNYIKPGIVKTNFDTVNDNSIGLHNIYGYILGNIDSDVTSYMKNELTQLFGKHSTRVKLDYNYYVWIVGFKGYIFNIYTHKKNGTHYSTNADISEDNLIDIEFLNELNFMLNKS